MVFSHPTNTTTPHPHTTHTYTHTHTPHTHTHTHTTHTHTHTHTQHTHTYRHTYTHHTFTALQTRAMILVALRPMTHFAFTTQYYLLVADDNSPENNTELRVVVQ